MVCALIENLEQIIAIMYEDINGYRLKPVSPKMFRYDIEGHHDTLWENEKGVRYYLATNIVKNTSFYNKLVGNYTTINYRVKKVNKMKNVKRRIARIRVCEEKKDISV